MAAAPVIGMPLSQRGQVEHAAVAPSPRTYAPESMSPNIAAALPRASQVNGLGFARPGPAAGQRTPTAKPVRTTSSSSAFARGTVTQGPGSARIAVIGPRIGWIQ